MKKKKQPIFDWDELTGTAICILKYNDNIFTGVACCHEDDLDMKSKKTGCEIALRRAEIDALKYYKNELQTSLKALNQLFYSMVQSNKFNENSYENKMLQRQIRLIQNDLDTTKEIIAQKQKSLKTYISEKDYFYKRIRKNREKAKSI